MPDKYVTFRTSRFESKTPQPHFINERCFGEDLAVWLRASIDNHVFAASEPIQEDYGWGFWSTIRGDPYWTAIGIMDDSIGHDDAEWLVTIRYDPGFRLLKRLFHRPRTGDLLSLCRAVDAALRSEPAIRSVEWWDGEPQVGEPRAAPV
jgi:hypothetical protein